MTAPDQCCINVKKLLSIRRRPHMTHSGHERPLLLRCTALTCYNWSMILRLGEKPMGRREFIALFGSGVAGWPLAARVQQAAAEALGVKFSDNLLSFAKLSNESGGLLYEIVTRGVNA